MQDRAMEMIAEQHHGESGYRDHRTLRNSFFRSFFSSRLMVPSSVS